MLTKRARLNAIKQSKKWQEYRLDWRDPKMPVLREYTFATGVKKEVVDPDYERRYHEHLMAQDGQEPEWKKDPTYNLRRKK